MKYRFLVFAAVPSLLLGACGGDSDESATTPAAAAPASPTLEPPRTPVNEGPALELAFGPTALNLTLAELKALPTTTVTVDGTSVTGVALTVLQSKVAAEKAETVTVAGYREGWTSIGTFRKPMAEMGATVVYVDSGGYVSITGPQLEKADRMRSIQAIRFP